MLGWCGSGCDGVHELLRRTGERAGLFPWGSESALCFVVRVGDMVTAACAVQRRLGGVRVGARVMLTVGEG